MLTRIYEAHCFFKVSHDTNKEMESIAYLQ